MSSLKTTIAGIAAGALYVFASHYQPGMSWRQWATGAALAAVGVLAKDFDISGKP